MASVTVNHELDSLFLKGLRLLHSSEPDAEEQLQQLWKQSVIDKYGSERTPISVLHKIIVPSALKRENADTTSEPVEIKRPKLESSVFSKSTASASPQRIVSVDSEINNSSSNDDSDSEPPLEILNADAICKKCKTSTSSNNNKLVECVDCHQHYHQLCHFPPITDMDLSDPRFVWYCSSCDQSISTTTTGDKTKTGSSSSVGAVKSGNSSKGSATTTKSGRLCSTNSNKSSAQGSAGSTRSKTSESSSKDSSNSSNTPEKKGHMMKKRSMKKPDKKKT